MRTLETRLDEYVKNLRSIADQLDVVIQQVESVRMDENPETQPLRDSIKLYRLIADDLAKISAGQELQDFFITGELPLHKEPPKMPDDCAVTNLFGWRCIRIAGHVDEHRFSRRPDGTIAP